MFIENLWIRRSRKTRHVSFKTILAVRLIFGRRIEKGKQTFYGFINIEKTIDNTDQDKLFRNA